MMSRPWRVSAERAGDQRPVGPRPPLPDHHRPSYIRRASRAAGRADPGLGGRRQQHVLRSFSSRPRPSSASSSTSPVRQAYAPDRATTWPCAAELQGPASRSPDDPGQRRGARALASGDGRHLGLHGRCRQVRGAAVRAWSPYRVDEALMSRRGPGRPLHALPAGPPRKARRSPTAVIDGPHARWSGTRRRTASTPRNRSWLPGASGRSRGMRPGASGLGD